MWLANTSHILIDSAQKPRVMSTIAFRKMIKSQYALPDLLMFKDTNFNQMMVAEHGRFSFTPLNGKNLEQIRCQQNACNIQLHTHFTNMVAKERSILANFQTLNNMVIDTGHYEINPQLPLGTSTTKTTEVEGNQRKTRSLFELI